MDIVITHPTVEEFRTIAVLAYREQDWSLSVENFALWLKWLGKENFFLAKDATTGEPVGFVAGVRHSKDQGYIGMYYVKKILRGSGIGSKIWAKAMEWLHGRNVSLSADLSMWQRYRDREGFVIEHSWKIMRSSGAPALSLTSSGPGKSYALLTPDDVVLADLQRYDRSVAGYDRDKMIELMLQDPAGVCRVAVEPKSGTIVGYGILRPSYGQWRLGPLFANSEEIATAVASALCQAEPRTEKSGVIFLWRSEHQGAERVVQHLGLNQQLTWCKELATKHEIVVDNRVFALTDYEVNIL